MKTNAVFQAPVSGTKTYQILSVALPVHLEHETGVVSPQFYWPLIGPADSATHAPVLPC